MMVACTYKSRSPAGSAAVELRRTGSYNPRALGGDDSPQMQECFAASIINFMAEKILGIKAANAWRKSGEL